MQRWGSVGSSSASQSFLLHTVLHSTELQRNRPRAGGLGLLRPQEGQAGMVPLNESRMGQSTRRTMAFRSGPIVSGWDAPLLWTLIVITVHTGTCYVLCLGQRQCFSSVIGFLNVLGALIAHRLGFGRFLVGHKPLSLQ